MEIAITRVAEVPSPCSARAISRVSNDGAMIAIRLAAL
jgi:hypothetical protein